MRRAIQVLGIALMAAGLLFDTSARSRNRRAGELIAQGTTPEEAVESIGMVVEGLTTAPVLRDLATRLGIDPSSDVGVRIAECGFEPFRPARTAVFTASTTKEPSPKPSAGSRNVTSRS